MRPPPTHRSVIERISIELGNRCDKACWFCYAGSEPEGATRWSVATALEFVRDCAVHGVRAVSFGGGEPLQWPGLFELLRASSAIPVGGSAASGARLFRSLTTNGLLLDDCFDELIAAAPDKVHVSIHFHTSTEIARVIDSVLRLADAGVRSGVNVLIRRSEIDLATQTVAELKAAGIGPERMVLLPMRGMDTPSAAEVAAVAESAPFQSMSCLSACAISPRFCAVSWDWTVGWCSYTRERKLLESPSYAALELALGDLGLRYCGGSLEDSTPKLIGLPRRYRRNPVRSC